MLIGFKYFIVPAALAAFPEFRVVSKRCKCHRTEAQLIVHLHNRRSGGYAEYLCIREHFARVLEYPSLYPHRESDASEAMCHYKSGIGYILLSSPGLYI